MPQGGNGAEGLNENYARELMELHTLGVDGGYTQKDVTELARVLTGWSIGRTREARPGRVRLPRALHDAGSKTVLGHALSGRAAAWKRASEAIRILARQPATARHIAFQLCQRLVADDASRGARRAGRAALPRDARRPARDRARDRDEPGVLRPEYYRAKVKSPFEYAVSAIRAAGGETTDGPPIAPADRARWESRSTSVSRRRATPTRPTPG